jgi:AMP deaminase
MFKSLQRLGDNPKDWDGNSKGLDGFHPDSENGVAQTPLADRFEPWNIYPKPPPPHWHWTDDKVVGQQDRHEHKSQEFNFKDCHIPGEESGRSFKLDDKGVYQVYDAKEGKSLPSLIN